MDHRGNITTKNGNIAVQGKGQLYMNTIALTGAGKQYKTTPFTATTGAVALFTNCLGPGGSTEVVGVFTSGTKWISVATRLVITTHT